MRSMAWCRCPVCKHKMFMYDPDGSRDADINIKCSSCKRIIDVKMTADAVTTKEVICDE